jgi:hypothetical protein
MSTEETPYNFVLLCNQCGNQPKFCPNHSACKGNSGEPNDKRQWLRQERVILESRLQVPKAVAIGLLETLTDEELEDQVNDLAHEQSRRNASLAA